MLLHEHMAFLIVTTFACFTADFSQVLRPLGNMDLDHLPELQNKITPNATDAGDAISAIVLAVQLITEFTILKSGKPGVYARKIILLTDGQGMIDGGGIEQIANRINECGITLVVV